MPEPDLVPWLAAPDELDVREGVQKLEEPLRRLREQLLWFDLALDPRGPALEQALSSCDQIGLQEYLATDERDLLESEIDQPNLTAHRINQANLRLLLGLAELHGVELIAGTYETRKKSAQLQWQDAEGFRVAADPHLALSRAKKMRRRERKASSLADGLTRWGALLKDPAFVVYVHAEIETLGDDLVGKDDVETILYAVSSALSDVVGGEARRQLSDGSTRQVFELTEVALASGLDPRVWTSAFKPLRSVFLAELTELQMLLEGAPRVSDVELYLSRVESRVRHWTKVRDQGVLGLDAAVDSAATAAMDALRTIDEPAAVVDRIDRVLEHAEKVARSESTKERARELRATLRRYWGSLCNYCAKREANPENSTVLQGSKVLGTKQVGFGTTTTLGTIVVLIPRCATCGELHEWLRELTTSLWLSIGVTSLVAFVVLGARVGFGGIFWGAVALSGAGYATVSVVRQRVTPPGDVGYWDYQNTRGYQPIVRGGYAVFAHDCAKGAFARLRKHGPRHPASGGVC